MKDSKIVEVLRTFSKEEFKEFEKFAASPFFSQGRDLTSLLKAVKKFYPEFAHKKFTKENIYKEMYSGAYNDKILRPMLSNLLKMSEEYLMQVAFRSYPSLKHSLLAQETISRQLESITGKNISLAEKFAEEYGVDDSYFRILLDIKQSKIDYNLFRDKQILVCDDVKEHAKFTIYYFIGAMSKFIHNLEANKATFNASYNDHIAVKFFNNFNLEKFLSEVNDEKYKDIIQIYLLITLSYLHIENEEYFLELKQMIFKNIESFRKYEQQSLLITLIALCTQKGSKFSNKKYLQEYFELVKFFLSKKLYKLSEHNYFPVVIFRTFFMSILKLKELDWLNKYVEDYIQEVAPEHRRNLKLLCKAQIDFAKGNFEEALEEASRIDFQQFLFKYDVKTLILKVYYEKNFIQEALYGIDSFLHFISNNKNVSEITNLQCNNFIKTYKKLILFKNGESDLNLEALRNEMFDKPNIYEKRWLLEKIEELKKRQG